MAFIQKNIWMAFYAIVFGSLLVLFSIVYFTYNDTYQEFRIKQESITSMSANSLKALFQQHELVLDVLIKQLMLHQKYTNRYLSHEIISNALNQDYAMQSFAILSPNGIMFANSWSLDEANTFSLLDRNETKEDFQKTIDSHQLVIGRTYYNDFLKKLIIPIRKAAYDKQGNVLFIMSAALDMEVAFTFFVSNSKLSHIHDTYLFREHDRYFQIAPQARYRDPKIYSHQIPLQFVEAGLQKIVDFYHIPIETIKKDAIVTSIVENNPKKEALLSSIFLKEYDLWLTTEVKLHVIQTEIYKKISFFILLYLSVMLLFYGLFRNIAQAEKQKKKALEFQANHDYLTHIKNRFFLDNHFKTIDTKTPFSLLFIDTDNFKTINDNYGHDYGDFVLKSISQRLFELKKQQDIFIRYSGDEFLLISYNEDKQCIATLCQEILTEISRAYEIKENRFFLSASIGVAQFPRDGKTFDEIKRYANLALYEAKKEKNCFVFFEDSIKEIYLYQATIEHELKGALKAQEFYMVYQPQVSNDGHIYGVEALLRWENKKLGPIAPDVFISLAESTGLMSSIGHFVMEQSLVEMGNLHTLLPHDLHLSINISVKQFIQDTFIESISALLKTHHYTNLHLVFEVTENVFINDVEGIIQKLLTLKNSGIHISLDDFGTGYSSLSLLKKLPIDELKIDKSFISDILENKDSYSMVEGIIAIGKKLNMRILAEGIETKEQKELLEQLGCDLYQGYFYAKPMRVEQLKEFCLK